MHIRRVMLMASVLFIAGSTLPAQSSKNGAPADSGNVFRTETKLVLVDAVVTDKKGNYVRDLTAKDFRVWEDKTEQTVKSFSFEGSVPSPGTDKQYVVFFFDNTSMSLTDQARARQSAAQFAAANFGPNKMMAVADFGGGLKLTQSFTADPELLSKALRDVKQATVSSPVTAGQGGSNADLSGNSGGLGRGGLPGNGPGGNGSLGNNPGASGPGSDSVARSALMALKIMARNLSSLPGRKALILFTGRLAISEEHMSELNATVNACNMANVTVYTVDVRGVGRLAQAFPERPTGLLAGLRRTLLEPMSYLGESDSLGSFATSFMPQARGGGAPGGGAPVGGGASGGGARGGGAPGGGTSAPSNPGTGFPGNGGQTGRGPGTTFPGNNPNPNTTPGNPNDPRNRNSLPNQGEFAPPPNQEVAHLLVRVGQI